MKPVLQTIRKGAVGDPPFGNCHQACIASILEIPIDLLPPRMAPDDAAYLRELADVLAPWNLSRLRIEYGDDTITPHPTGYAIGTVPSELAPVDGLELQHAVVLFNDQIVHDPAGPRTKPYGPILDFEYIVVLDPTKPIRLPR